jgi:hypothetical protein
LCKESIKVDPGVKIANHTRYTNFRAQSTKKIRLASIAEPLETTFNGVINVMKKSSRNNSVCPSIALAEEELRIQVSHIWKENGTQEKFVELEELMERRHLV